MIRMFELVAEDAAIEDTLYYLNRALESGVLDTDSFLKVNERRDVMMIIRRTGHCQENNS